MTTIRISFQILRSFLRLSKDNWGFPLIVGFLALLFTAATLLSLGLAEIADNVAVCAYFSLATGVVLQLIYFGKNRKTGDISYGTV